MLLCYYAAIIHTQHLVRKNWIIAFQRIWELVIES